MIQDTTIQEDYRHVCEQIKMLDKLIKQDDGSNMIYSTTIKEGLRSYEKKLKYLDNLIDSLDSISNCY